MSRTHARCGRARRRAPARRHRRTPHSARYGRREARARAQDRPPAPASPRAITRCSLTQTSASGDSVPETAMTRAVAGARLQPRIDFAAGLVVDADERDLGVRHQPLLDRRVAREIAMPVEMVRGDVDQKSDAGAKRGREVDLIGRTFNDMGAARRRRRQVENRHADIAAHRDFAPGLFQHMGDERRGRRFAVGAGDGDERRVRRSRAALAHEEFDVADDRNPRRVRKVDRPMRLRMGQRHAGREHKHLGSRASRRERDRPARRPRLRRAPARPGCRPTRPLPRRRRQAPAPSTAPSRRGRRGRRSVRAGSRPASSSPQLQRGEADHRKHEGDDPEAHHDLRLRPAELLEMMMNGRHAEHPPAGELERQPPARRPTPPPSRTSRRTTASTTRA